MRKLRQLGFEVRRDDESGGDVGADDARFFIFTAGGRRAREHMEISLRRGIELERLSPLTEIQSELAEHAADGHVRVWGARPGSGSERDGKARPGDVGLVYSEGQLLLSVEVFAKAKSEDVARSIWGESDEGEVSACMSFLDPVEEVDISIDALRDALGYKPNYVPQGFEIPGDDAQARIREQYGSASRLISALTGAGPKQRVWWVNQNQTFRQERKGGFLWAPKRNSAGRSQAHWDALTRARPGDVVLSYEAARSQLGALLNAELWTRRRRVSTSPRGRMKVDASTSITRTWPSLFSLSDIPSRWRIDEGGPFDRNGGVKQGYLFPLSDEFVAKMAERFPQLGLQPGMIAANERLSVDALRSTAEDPRFGLRLDDSLYAALVAALESGKHIILTGPPGTAKTTLAQIAGDTAKQLGLCSGCVLTTATADWTTYETIGGLRPGNGNRLEFEFGHFLKAIEANQWLVIRTEPFAVRSCIWSALHRLVGSAGDTSLSAAGF